MVPHSRLGEYPKSMVGAARQDDVGAPGVRGATVPATDAGVVIVIVVVVPWLTGVVVFRQARRTWGWSWPGVDSDRAGGGADECGGAGAGDGRGRAECVDGGQRGRCRRCCWWAVLAARCRKCTSASSGHGVQLLHTRPGEDASGVGGGLAGGQQVERAWLGRVGVSGGDSLRVVVRRGGNARVC